MDFDLPDMDGKELLEFIRKSDCNGDTPVVAILRASDRSSIPDLHIQGFVEQPVDLRHLSEALWRTGLSPSVTNHAPEPV